jgi:hypothetical protein
MQHIRCVMQGIGRSARGRLKRSVSFNWAMTACRAVMNLSQCVFTYGMRTVCVSNG